MDADPSSRDCPHAAGATFQNEDWKGPADWEAGLLEADLIRFATKQPVAARKHTLIYLATTFLRRQARRSALAGVPVLSGLVAGGVIYQRQRVVAERNEGNLRYAHSLTSFTLQQLKDPSKIPLYLLTATVLHHGHSLADLPETHWTTECNHQLESILAHHHWAQHVLSLAFHAVETGSETTRAALPLLRLWILADPGDTTLKETAKTLGSTHAVAQTVSHPEDIDDELRHTSRRCSAAIRCSSSALF